MRALVSAAMLFCPALCFSQASVDASCLADFNAPAAQTVIGASFATQITAIRECLDNGDAACAEDGLDAIDDDELTDDELGVYWIAAGDFEDLDGSSRRARREYRRAINQRGANRQLVAAALEKSAISHLKDENFDDIVDVLEDLECGEWTPTLVYYQARGLFGDAEFAQAEIAARLAVTSQEATGERVPAMWRSFMTAATMRAEQAASEELICRNERVSGSNIPRRICTTAAERERQVREAEEAFTGDNAIIMDEPQTQ